MNQHRTLQLRREVLAELTPEELAAIAGGEGPTDGGVCKGILVAAAAITAGVTVATAMSMCVTCVCTSEAV